jgi:hypothetical protein
MKKLLAFLLIFSATIAQAQIDSVIYGVNANPPDLLLTLAKINPVTGVVTTISGTNYPYSESTVGRTIDPIHRIYYQVDDSVLLAFNLNTGNLLSSNPVTELTNSIFIEMNYNCPDSTLYGLSFDTTNADIRLSWLEPGTGIVHIISSNPLPDQISVLAGNAINSYTSVYYYVSANHKIVGVDLATGNTLSDPTVNISYGTFGPIVFDCQDSTIYGLAGNMTNGRKFAKINPETGLVTYISPGNITMAIYSDMATIDPFKRLYYFKNADNTLAGVNIETGEFYTDPAIQFTPGTEFFNFFYNHPCYVSYPLNISNLELQTQSVVIYPNPVVDFLFLKFNKFSSGRIEVFSTLGDLILSQNFAGQNLIKLNLADITQGVYLIKIIQRESAETHSFIKL